MSILATTQPLEQERNARNRLLLVGAHGAAWLGGSQFIAQFLHTGIRILLARLLAPDAFGLLAAAVAFTAASQLLIELGFGAAIIQRRDLDREHSGTAFWSMLGCALVVSGALFLASPVIAGFYQQSDVRTVLQVLSVGLVLGIPDSYYSAIMSRQLRFSVIGIRKIVSVVIAGCVSLILALSGAGVWSLVAYTLLQTAVGSCLLVLAARSLPPVTFSIGAFQTLWRFSRPLVGARVFNYLNRNADNLIIGRLLGVSALGQYAVAYQLLLLPLHFVSRPIAAVSLPLYSSIQDEKHRLGRAYLRSVDAIMSLTWPLGALVAVSAAAVIPMLIGEKWAPAASMAAVFGPVAALQSMKTFSLPALQAIGETRLVLLWSATGTTMNVSAFWVGSHFGLAAIPWALLITVAVGTPVHFAMVKRALDFQVAVLLASVARWTVVSLIVAALFFAASGSWLDEPSPLLLISGFGVAVPFLLYAFWKFHPDIAATFGHEIRKVLRCNRSHQEPI